MYVQRLRSRFVSSLHGKTFVDDQLSTWSKALDFDISTSLHRHGYAIMDNAFDPALATNLRQEIINLQDQFYPNSTHIYLDGKEKPLLLTKHHIHEMELLTVPSEQQHLSQWFENPTIRQTMNQVIPTLEAKRQMIKIQHNTGDGGCFPMHFDTYGQDGKCLTSILYLNEEWTNGHGGELVLYPFPYSPVTIEPLFNRLVLFSSNQLLHRVLPASKTRYALTTWLYKDPSPTTSPPQNPPSSNDAYIRMITKLSDSPFRRHLAKLYYADEWRQSLIESHLDTPAFQEYMTNFEAELVTIEKATQTMLNTFSRQGGIDFPSTPSKLFHRLRQDFQCKDLLTEKLVRWF